MVSSHQLQRKGEGLNPSATVACEFKKAEFKAPLANVKAMPGLLYNYYERFFYLTENMEGLTPEESGVMDRFTIEKAKAGSYFGYQFTGYIRVPKDGVYTFYLESNDGSSMYIDDEELIENEGNHGAVEEPGAIGLKAGMHKIKVRYFQCGGGKALKVSWKGPGFQKQEIGAGYLFYESE